MKTSDIRQFRRALRKFTRLIDRQLKTCCKQVTLPQCLVLLEVEELVEPAMGQLAANLGLDTSTLTRTVDGLVDQGQVERRRSDSDRRMVTVRLTPSGRAVCKSINSDNDASWRRVFKRIPSSEQHDVVRHFDALVQAYLACDQQTSSKPACGGARLAARTPNDD